MNFGTPGPRETLAVQGRAIGSRVGRTDMAPGLSISEQ